MNRFLGVAAVAAFAGTFVPLAVEKIPLESLGIGGWVRSIVLLVLAIACPLAVAAALTRQRAITAFANVMVWPMRSFECRLIPVLGLLLLVLTLVLLQVALGLVFDPRYKDFPYAPLSAAVGSLFILSLFPNAAKTPRALAEQVAAGVLALSLIYILFNESFLNWQAVWLCGLLAALAFTLLTVRDARG